MILVVTGVGFLIHVYSIGYMAHEGGYYRFFGYLNLFMFFMLMLVLANNYVLLFVGWEGVGLCSYLLIGFYFHTQVGRRRGQEGVHRQPHRRRRLRPRACSLMLGTLGTLRFTGRRPRRSQAGSFEVGDRRADARLRCCCSSAPPASRRRFRCTSGCRTPWKARRRFAR